MSQDYFQTLELMEPHFTVLWYNICHIMILLSYALCAHTRGFTSKAATFVYLNHLLQAQLLMPLPKFPTVLWFPHQCPFGLHLSVSA